MAIPSGDIGQTFAWFADNVFGNYSPLYTRLCRAVADAPVVQRLAAAVPDRQPLPNMIFGAVHERLLSGVAHSLAAFFPSVSGEFAPDGDPVPVFLDFCEQYEAALLPILQTHRVQTNEVRRSALWLPAMAVAAESHGGRPLSLIECGTSAGLNLLWDRYGYDYGDAGRYGDPDSPVQLNCTLRGPHRPRLPGMLPNVVGRLGIDLNPVDVHDANEVRWLRALLWPEQHARAALLLAAVAIARAETPTLWAGDLLARLPDAVDRVPEAVVPVIMHSFTFNQLSAEDRDRAEGIVGGLGARRDLSRLSIEWLAGETPTVTHTSYRQGKPETTVLAMADQHGNWLEWLVPAADRS